MKKLIIALSVLIVASSFTMPSCFKHHPTSGSVHVDITFDDDAEVVTFTGEQGQGVYVFNSANTSLSLPNTGTYQICISWTGGCGAYRLNDGTNNILSVGPAGGSTCGNGFTVVGLYHASTNCE